MNSDNIKLLCIFISLCLLISCTQPKERLYRKSTILMDTIVTITVVADSEEKASSAIDSAFEEIKKLEKLINFWSPESEISDINRNAGIKEVAVSPHTLDMVEKALFISEKTQGAFDATVGPLMRLYNFKGKIKPDKSLIKEKLPIVNYKLVSIKRNKSTVFLKKKGMSFDTGGIAKGYAVDRAVKRLETKGISAGIVAIAGDIKTFGVKPDGRGWVIGIRNPRPKGKADDIMATVELTDSAISTSGDYERYFIEDGIRYNHILNPKTGKPADALSSVTIISKEGVYSDGFSTGIFVMGMKEGIPLIKDIGFEAIIVDKEGVIYVTEGIKDRVKFKRYEDKMPNM